MELDKNFFLNGFSEEELSELDKHKALFVDMMSIHPVSLAERKHNPHVTDDKVDGMLDGILARNEEEIMACCRIYDMCVYAIKSSKIIQQIRQKNDVAGCMRYIGDSAYGNECLMFIVASHVNNSSELSELISVIYQKAMHERSSKTTDHITFSYPAHDRNINISVGNNGLNFYIDMVSDFGLMDLSDDEKVDFYLGLDDLKCELFEICKEFALSALYAGKASDPTSSPLEIISVAFKLSDARTLLVKDLLNLADANDGLELENPQEVLLDTKGFKYGFVPDEISKAALRFHFDVDTSKPKYKFPEIKLDELIDGCVKLADPTNMSSKGYTGETSLYSLFAMNKDKSGNLSMSRLPDLKNKKKLN